MRNALTLIGSALLLGAASVSAAPRVSAKGEADLAKALAGRVAGKPVDCLVQRNIRSTQIFDGTAILYEVGRTYYVVRPLAASSLRSDDIMITDTHTNQLCSVDIVRMVDSSSLMSTGSVGLSSFVPYTKPKV